MYKDYIDLLKDVYASDLADGKISEGDFSKFPKNLSSDLNTNILKDFLNIDVSTLSPEKQEWLLKLNVVLKGHEHHGVYTYRETRKKPYAKLNLKQLWLLLKHRAIFHSYAVPNGPCDYGQFGYSESLVQNLNNISAENIEIVPSSSLEEDHWNLCANSEFRMPPNTYFQNFSVALNKAWKNAEADFKKSYAESIQDLNLKNNDEDNTKFTEIQDDLNELGYVLEVDQISGDWNIAAAKDKTPAVNPERLATTLSFLQMRNIIVENDSDIAWKAKLPEQDKTRNDGDIYFVNHKKVAIHVRLSARAFRLTDFTDLDEQLDALQEELKKPFKALRCVSIEALNAATKELKKWILEANAQVFEVLNSESEIAKPDVPKTILESISDQDAIMELWNHKVPFFVRKIVPGASNITITQKTNDELNVWCKGLIDRPASVILKGTNYSTVSSVASGIIFAPTTELNLAYKQNCHSSRNFNDAKRYRDVGGKYYFDLNAFLQKGIEDQARIIDKSFPQMSTKHVAQQFQQKFPNGFNSFGLNARMEFYKELNIFIRSLMTKDNDELQQIVFQQVLNRYEILLLNKGSVIPQKVRKNARAFGEVNGLTHTEALLKARSSDHKVARTDEHVYKAKHTTERDTALQLHLAQSGDIIGVFVNLQALEQAYQIWTILSAKLGKPAPAFTYTSADGLKPYPIETYSFQKKILDNNTRQQILNNLTAAEIATFSAGIGQCMNTILLQSTNAILELFLSKLESCSQEVIENVLNVYNVNGNVFHWSMNKPEQLKRLLGLLRKCRPEVIKPLMAKLDTNHRSLFAAAPTDAVTFRILCDFLDNSSDELLHAYLLFPSPHANWFVKYFKDTHVFERLVKILAIHHPAELMSVLNNPVSNLPTLMQSAKNNASIRNKIINAMYEAKHDAELQLERDALGNVIGALVDAGDVESSYQHWKTLGAAAPAFIFDVTRGLIPYSFEIYDYTQKFNNPATRQQFLDAATCEQIFTLLNMQYQNGITTLAYPTAAKAELTGLLIAKLAQINPALYQDIINSNAPNGSSFISQAAQWAPSFCVEIIKTLSLDKIAIHSAVIGTCMPSIISSGILEPFLSNLENSSQEVIENVLNVTNANGNVFHWAMNKPVLLKGLLGLSRKCRPEIIKPLMAKLDSNNRSLFAAAPTDAVTFSILLDHLENSSDDLLHAYLLFPSAHANWFVKYFKDTHVFQRLIRILAIHHPGDFMLVLNDPISQLPTLIESAKVNTRIRNTIIIGLAQVFVSHENQLPYSVRDKIRQVLSGHTERAVFYETLFTLNPASFFSFINKELNAEKLIKKRWWRFGIKAHNPTTDNIVNYFMNIVGDANRTALFNKMMTEQPASFLALITRIQERAPNRLADVYASVLTAPNALFKDLKAINPEAYAQALAQLTVRNNPNAVIAATAACTKTLTKADLKSLLDWTKAATRSGTTMFSRVFHHADHYDVFAKQLRFLLVNIGKNDELTPEQNRFLRVMVEDYSTRPGAKLQHVIAVIEQSNNYVTSARKPDLYADLHEDYKNYLNIMRKPPRIDYNDVLEFMVKRAGVESRKAVIEYLSETINVFPKKRCCI